MTHVTPNTDDRPPFVKNRLPEDDPQYVSDDVHNQRRLQDAIGPVSGVSDSDCTKVLGALFAYLDSVEPETAQRLREGPKNRECRCGHKEDTHCVTRDGLRNLAECALVVCDCDVFVLASTDEEKL